MTKLIPIKETRVVTTDDSCRITSICEVSSELYKIIVQQNITSKYRDTHHIYHNCIIHKNGAHVSMMTMVVPIKFNRLDKIVELSNLLTSFHYDLLTKYQLPNLIERSANIISSALQTEDVVKHDAQSKIRKLHSPWKN